MVVVEVLTNLIPQDGFNNLRYARGNGDWATVIRVILLVQWINMCLFRFIGKARYFDEIVHKKN